jgi:hypothetical protein
MRHLLILLLYFWPGIVLAQTISNNAPFSLQLMGVAHAIDMNSTADQPVTIHCPATTCRINTIFVINPSIAMTTVIGGIYTATSKAGVAIVAAAQTYNSLTTNAPNTNGNLFGLPIAGATIATNQSTIWISFTTPQGAAATADFYFYGFPLP